MAVRMETFSREGEEISNDLFGGNLLANRGELYGEGQYDTAINDLGVTTLRYPGGSRTEKSFDINNPDAERVLDKQTGQIDDWIALSDFFAYAEENGHPVSIVLPTRFNLSEDRDESGNRTPDFDEGDLRTFVRDVASGVYGTPEIHAFEIGNEYWHSGQMNSVEYGRLASKMTQVIDDELSAVAAEHPDSADIQITVQMGYNYGDADLSGAYDGMTPQDTLDAVNAQYGLTLGQEALYNSGGVNWGFINNKIIINEFEKTDTIDDVDGVIAHVYSLGASNEWSRVFELKLVDDTWIEEYPDLEIHVTEWNLKGVTEQLDRDVDYGLHQAEEMLNMMEEFIRVGVDHAHVWPLINWTDNALNNGWTYGDTNAPGAMFRMMADNLPGKTLLDFNPASDRVTEAEFEDISVHGFAGDSELVLYITSMGQDGVVNTDLDLTTMLVGFDTMDLTILGVEDGAMIGSNRSDAVLEQVDPTLAYDDGILDVSLDPHEILQVVIKGVQPTDDLAPFMEPASQEAVFDVSDRFFSDAPEARDDAPSDDFDIPMVPLSADADDAPYVDDDSEDAAEDMDDDMGLSFLLALLPVLGLLAFVG